MKDRRYVLLRDSDTHGICAMVELSSRMAWSKTHARVWRSPPFHYWKPGYFIARVGSKNCPVKVAPYVSGKNNNITMRSS